MQERLDRLFEAVGGATSVLILPHNDPDPDAIASALALRHLLAERLGVKSHIAYKGIIGRAENKALVRYIGYPLRPLAGSDLRQSAPIALVDTQPGAGNNALPPKSTATIVIDHHPWLEGTAAADFADVRSDVGATSTILTEYLQAAGIELVSSLATALFYGIKTDTMGLSRAASPADVAAYFYLQSRIDIEALGEIEQAQVPAEYFQKLDTALHAVWIYDGTVISYMGPMGHPDLAAEMADILLRLEGTQWVVCIGIYEDNLILAARTRSRWGGAEGLVRAIVGNQGTAGGHGTMAGGRVLLQGEDPEQVALQFGQRALRYLKVPPEMVGKPLI